MSKLWRFTDNQGSFRVDGGAGLKGLYFPLCNERVISSIAPDLHGDLKSGQDAYLLEPVTRIGLSTSRSSRNFWVYISKDKVWSAAGVSKSCFEEQVSLEAGLLWHKVSRTNKSIGLKSEILSFVPATGEPVEIMQVTLTNISPKPVSIIPTAAIPMFCRGAASIRDHRHVTSLLQRLTLNRYGVISKPTLLFDEAGHKPNKDYYFVLGWDEAGRAPRHIYPTQEIFCGGRGDLEAPESVLKNALPGKLPIQGKEPMGGLRFKKILLKPGREHSYIVLMGISQNPKEIAGLFNKFNSCRKVAASLQATKLFWNNITDKYTLSSPDSDFKRWFRWVSIQPTLRRICGCSFLPDFDYGKGGRGWRDLWQDCLGLILNNPKSVRRMLVDNFTGVRFDGSNATIIAKERGEFIADRNDIARVWADHGVWPLLTLELYLEKSGDNKILFEKAPYFTDRHIRRSRKLLNSFKPSGYRGTIFEHLLVENLTQFYNVGEHNHLRLEGADWNDGLDMAKERGESVAFGCMYSRNLRSLAMLLKASGQKKVSVFAELRELLKPCNYNSVSAKQKRLEDYFKRVESGISGKVVTLDADELCASLLEKSEWMLKYIRKSEWLKEGFFNGYYDNNGRRVEGSFKGRVRMMLASQVFAIMSGVADEAQVKKIIQSVNKYLYDPGLKGCRLNTDFGCEMHDFGRAFSFSYGDKENGAIFSHMAVMYAYALLSRGFEKEGERALISLYKLSMNTEKSKIYPCLPEYFDLSGRGMYSYLTGSASWYLLTLLGHNLI